MLSVARGSTYTWLAVLLAALLAMLAVRPADSEDYGAGLIAIAILIGASGLCLVLVFVALAAYYLAWRRGQHFLFRDKLVMLLSIVALAMFAWPVSWLVGS